MANIFPDKFYKNIFDSATEGVLVANTDGVIEEVNSSALKMFDYNKVEELTGNKIEMLIPSRYHKKHIVDREKYQKKRTNRSMGENFNLKGITQKGKEFFVEISLSNLDINNKKYTIALVTDITKRVDAENKLMELNTKLEEKVNERTNDLANALMELQHINEDLNIQFDKTKKAEKEATNALKKEKELGVLKSRFVSMASHEFRTPLSSILSSANLLEKYIDLTDKTTKHINRIKSSVKHLTEILNDFLSLDKLESGKAKYILSEFSVSELINEVIDEMGAITKEGQCFFLKIIGEAKIVKLDDSLLRNILTNLFSNAIKYSESGKKIFVDLIFEKDNFKVLIKDEGIGIPEDDKKHMFTRLFRAQNAMNIQGTGLGLNIVKKYIEILHGQISFDSVLGKGATFTVTLPLNIES